MITVCIPTIPGANPPKGRIYKMSPAELTELKKQLTQYLEKNWIRPSYSPFAAPVLFVRKSDGTLRMCIDYRSLNKITLGTQYPLPRIDTILEHIATSKCWTCLDLSKAYHQIRVKEEDVYKTSFITHLGQFEMRVLPFGMKTTPGGFQSYINAVFNGTADNTHHDANILDDFVVCYLDDIIIFSDTPEQHIDHIDHVLARLRKRHLYMNPQKPQ